MTDTTATTAHAAGEHRGWYEGDCPSCEAGLVADIINGEAGYEEEIAAAENQMTVRDWRIVCAERSAAR